MCELAIGRAGFRSINVSTGVAAGETFLNSIDISCAANRPTVPPALRCHNPRKETGMHKLRNFHLLGMLAAATATAAFAQTGAPGAAQTNRATQGVT